MMIIKNNCRHITETVMTALKSGEKEIVFEKGTYHFYPENSVERHSCISNHDNDGMKKVGIQIENVQDVTVDGGGSDFVFHGIMLPVAVECACRIKLCNFSVNYPIPVYVHSTVLDAGHNFCDVKLWDNTPYRMEGNVPYFIIDGGHEFTYDNVLEINAELECIEYGTNDRDYFTHHEAVELAPGILRVYQDFPVIPKRGNYMLWHLAKRYAPAVFINASEDVTVENVTVHHSLGMGLLAQLTRNIMINRFRVTPSEGRYVSAYGDGVHFVECSGNICVENCVIEKQMDDPLNCHGIYACVEQVNDCEVFVRLKHPQAQGIPIFGAGDKVEYIAYDTLLSYGNNVVLETEMCSESLIRLTLERKPTLKIGDYLENISHTPNLTVRDCYFGKNRARGLLITTRGKVLVQNNVFERTGAAIRISGDCNFWYESGCVRDVTIADNTFIDLNANPRWGKAVIDIAPQVLRTAGPVHKNIRIIGNTFQTFDIPLLWANCTENIIFKENKIIRTKTFPPKGLIKESVTLIDCICTEINE